MFRYAHPGSLNKACNSDPHIRALEVCTCVDAGSKDGWTAARILQRHGNEVSSEPPSAAYNTNSNVGEIHWVRFRLPTLRSPSGTARKHQPGIVTLRQWSAAAAGVLKTARGDPRLQKRTFFAQPPRRA